MTLVKNVDGCGASQEVSGVSQECVVALVSRWVHVGGQAFIKATRFELQSDHLEPMHVRQPSMRCFQERCRWRLFIMPQMRGKRVLAACQAPGMGMVDVLNAFKRPQVRDDVLQIDV